MIKGRYVIKIDGEVVAERDNLITTNGFFMINRHLARSSIEWAGALAIGAITTAPSISDKTLYYELDRMPITLKSYQKINPRYTITNKALAAGVVTLQFTSTTTPTMALGYKIQVTGVDSVLMGTFSVNLTAGDYTVISAPTTTAAGVYQIKYNVSSATTITSTAVSSNTALISVLNDNLGNAVYNNEIVVKATVDPSLNLIISEVGVLPLNLKNKNNSYMTRVTDFSEQYTSDASLSAWADNLSPFTLPVVGLVNINTTNGYSWVTGGAVVTFNVASTAGLKVGSTIFLNGITPAGAYSAPSGAATITQINGNYQLVATMTSGTNVTGTTQTGSGGTMSLNSSTLVPASNSGKFNIGVTSGHTYTLQNISIDASNFSSSDGLVILYYSSAASSGAVQQFAVNLFDINGNIYNSGGGYMLTTTTVGWNVVRFPNDGRWPSTGAIINRVDLITVSLPATTIYLDEIKFVSNEYWSAHPSAGISSITALNSNSPSTGYVNIQTALNHNYSAGATVVISGMPTVAITAATAASATVATYTYNSSTQTAGVGSTVTITGMTPSYFNGTFVVTAIGGSGAATTFTVLGSGFTISGTASGFGVFDVWNKSYTIFSVPSSQSFVVYNPGIVPFAAGPLVKSISGTISLIPPEYQLTSRSVFPTPIYKYAGQQMDIEYHLQVT